MHYSQIESFYDMLHTTFKHAWISIVQELRVRCSAKYRLKLKENNRKKKMKIKTKFLRKFIFNKKNNLTTNDNLKLGKKWQQITEKILQFGIKIRFIIIYTCVGDWFSITALICSSECFIGFVFGNEEWWISHNGVCTWNERKRTNNEILFGFVKTFSFTLTKIFCRLRFPF